MTPSILAAIFPGRPVLAGTKMSPFWILLTLWMMEVVVTAGAIRYAKLQSVHRHLLLLYCHDDTNVCLDSCSVHHHLS